MSLAIVVEMPGSEVIALPAVWLCPVGLVADQRSLWVLWAGCGCMLGRDELVPCQSHRAAVKATQAQLT